LSLHASTYFRHTSLWQNIGMSSLLTDETYGVLMGELAHTDKVHPMWMHGNNLNSYVAWFIGTVAGTALGGLLPNPEVFGLDFALVQLQKPLNDSWQPLVLNQDEGNHTGNPSH